MKRVFRILSITIMFFIFWFSHQDGRESARQSTYVKKQVNKAIGKGVGFNIRKNAHFFIYMALGMSLLLSREKTGKRESLEIIGFVILYALSDEYHQSFIPGRGASFRDVCIDTLGGISGFLVVKTMVCIKNIYFYKKIVVKRDWNIKVTILCTKVQKNDSLIWDLRRSFEIDLISSRRVKKWYIKV